MGMSEQEFQEAKARHDAGELTLGEVELLRAQLEAAHAAARDGESDDDLTDEPFSNSRWQAPLGQRMEL
jgi:hypothetical protein